MGKSLLRALVLAAGVVAVSLALDLLVSLFYGAQWGRQFVVFRMALHGATFVFTALGAALGFAFVRAPPIAYARIALLGATLGVATFGVAMAGIRLGAYWAVLAWLIAGSALAAHFGAKVLGGKEEK